MRLGVFDLIDGAYVENNCLHLWWSASPDCNLMPDVERTVGSGLHCGGSRHVFIHLYLLACSEFMNPNMGSFTFNAQNSQQRRVCPGASAIIWKGSRYLFVNCKQWP